MFSKVRFLLIPTFISVLILTGCAPAQYMPQFDETTLREKQTEIGRQVARSPKSISEDPNAVLSRIYNRVAPHARVACIENGEKWLDSSCNNWSINVVEDENFNAYVTPAGDITFHSEVFKYTESDDELAFILSHEISHHILNHAMEDVVNGEIMGATTGLLYGILVGGIAAGLGASEDTVSDLIEDAMEDGYKSGRESGRLTYSIDQESEADKLGLKLLHAAGYDQIAARNMLLHIGVSADALRSQHNDSHPTGPERLAAFDYYLRSLNEIDRGYSIDVETKATNKNASRSNDACFGGCIESIGTQILPDGSKYEGGFKAGSRHGKGVSSFVDDDLYLRYEGHFYEGFPHGRGIAEISFDDITMRYDGRWRDGRPIQRERLTRVSSMFSSQQATEVSNTGFCDVSRWSQSNLVKDQKIKNDINFLIEDEVSNDAKVTVNVSSGVVLLVGQVNSEEEKNLIGLLVRGALNVRHVHNEISIAGRLSWVSRMSDATLETASICELNSKFGHGDIDVIAEDSVIYLMGRVSRSVGLAAANAISIMSGVAKVVMVYEYSD